MFPVYVQSSAPCLSVYTVNARALRDALCCVFYVSFDSFTSYMYSIAGNSYDC